MKFCQFSEINTAATAEEPQQQTIQETEPSQSESVPSQDAQDGADQQIDVSPKFVPSDATYDWKDITQEFFEAVKGMFRQIVPQSHNAVLITTNHTNAKCNNSIISVVQTQNFP